MNSYIDCLDLAKCWSRTCSIRS